MKTFRNQSLKASAFPFVVMVGLCPGLVGAQDSPATASAIADRFEERGALAFVDGGVVVPCEIGDPLVLELLSRDLTEQRTEDLATILGLGQWEDCPEPEVDRWLVAEIREIGEPLIPSQVETHQALWGALEHRDPPGAEYLWQEVAQGVDTDSAWRATALRRAGAAFDTPDEQVDFYLDVLADSTAPRSFLVQEATRLAATFPDAIVTGLGPAELVALPMPAGAFFVEAIGSIARNGNPAPTDVSNRARRLLLDAASLASGELGNFFRSRLPDPQRE